MNIIINIVYMTNRQPQALVSAKINADISKLIS